MSDGSEPAKVSPPLALPARKLRVGLSDRSRGRQTRGLTHELVETLASQLRGQTIQPGDKLPSESEIMAVYGVSRSVVREALSQLQAAGLVETHHGVGTFALRGGAEGKFELKRPTIASLADMLEVLELRASLESEAVGLAALRRSDAQLLEMRRALDDFESHVSIAGDTVSPDFRFHLLIAQSTGNRYFADLMGQLGLAVIPRSRVLPASLEPTPQLQHLQRVNLEHQDIYEAIVRRDPEFARAAMRIHLLNSRERQRKAYPA
jgi:DNA-binding FadR family transcriptional regulator